MIIAGADASGDEKNGQRRYISFVVGTKEKINSLYDEIGLREIHMVRLDEKQKERVIRILDFTKSDILAWCLKVDKQHIVDYMYNHPRLNNKHKTRARILNHFDRLILEKVRNKMEKFTYSHEKGLEDVSVQCEVDMEDTVKVWQMNPQFEGRAYEISDAIAWCNEKGKRLKGCKELNLSEYLKTKMEYDLLK
ncbi:MAG: hypothetical protein ACR2LL_03805 [Nitrosopumilus sp.]